MSTPSKVFISITTADKSQKEVEKRIDYIFSVAKQRFNCDLILLNTPDNYQINSGLARIGYDITYLKDADIVIFDSNFAISIECFLERRLCMRYDIVYYIFDDSDAEHVIPAKRLSPEKEDTNG